MDTQLRNAKYAVAVTPHDTTLLTKVAHKGLYVGVSGDVTVLTLGGNTVKFKAAPVGFIPVAVKRVNATGTTATDIVALA